MTASAWWRGALAGVLVGSAGLSGGAVAPLLVAAGVSTVAVPLLCFRQITPADWAATGLSCTLLALLLVSLGGAGIALLRQVRHTQRALAYLRLFAMPVARPLGRRLARLELAGRVDLVALDTPIAFCYGFGRPRILLSTGLIAALSADQLVALLLHENYHLTRRDPLKVALGGAAATAFFWLPAVRACYDQYLVEKEVEADAYVCARQGSDTPLVGALAALLDRGAGASAAQWGAVAGGTDALETRIDRLLGYGAPPALPWRAALLSGLLLAGLLLLEVGLLLNGNALGLRHIPQRLLTGC